MVGLGGLEPPTSPLSGVRSDQLSYRPAAFSKTRQLVLGARDECLTLSLKEVIQPQVPLRLPCYDFTPVAELTVVRCLLERLAHGRRVGPTPMV